MSMFSLLSALADSRVDYVLVGGLAVSLHGYQRVTLDVDVVVALDAQNLARFIECAKGADLRPVMPVALESLCDADLIDRWHREKGMIAFALRGADAMATVIDVIVRPVVAFENLKRDAIRKPVGPLSIPVASIDHLIEMKRDTGRSKDAIDVAELLKIKQVLGDTGETA